MLTLGESLEAHALCKRGWSMSAIARHLDRDRKTVRACLSGQRSRPGQTGSTGSRSTCGFGSAMTRTCSPRRSSRRSASSAMAGRALHPGAAGAGAAACRQAVRGGAVPAEFAVIEDPPRRRRAPLRLRMRTFTTPKLLVIEEVGYGEHHWGSSASAIMAPLVATAPGGDHEREIAYHC